MTYLSKIVVGAALAAVLTSCAVRQDNVRIYEKPADPHEWPAWLIPNDNKLEQNDKHFVYGTLDLSNNKRYGQNIERLPHEEGPSSDKAVSMLRDAVAISTGALIVGPGPNERSFTLTGDGYKGANPDHQEEWENMYDLADADGNGTVSNHEARSLLEAMLDAQLEATSKR